MKRFLAGMLTVLLCEILVIGILAGRWYFSLGGVQGVLRQAEQLQENQTPVLLRGKAGTSREVPLLGTLYELRSDHGSGSEGLWVLTRKSPPKEGGSVTVFGTVMVQKTSGLAQELLQLKDHYVMLVEMKRFGG